MSKHFSYEEHLKFDSSRPQKKHKLPYHLPQNPEQKLYRVMCVDEFKEFIGGKLSLTRVADFPDKLEGEITPLTSVSLFKNLTSNKEESEFKRNDIRKCSMYVSCWRMDEQESKEPWEVYSPQNKECLMSESTAKQLWRICPNIGAGQQEDSPRLAEVRYIDRNLEGEDLDKNTRLLFVHKSDVFRWEKETRIVKLDIEIKKQIEEFCKNNKCPYSFTGAKRYIYLTFDAQKVINRVILHPQANSDVKNKINSLLKEHSIPVVAENSKFHREKLR